VLGLRLLLGCPLLAVLIGQEPYLLRTDLGATEPLERGAGRAIRPRTACQQRCFLQGPTDRASLELGEQASGRTPAPPTPLTAKAPTRHHHASEGRSDDPTHRAFQPALRGPTVRTGLLLVFPLPDDVFQGFAHGLLSYFLDLLFHLA